MKTILLIGAGKSATVLIEYLEKKSKENQWKFIVADVNRQQILKKLSADTTTEAVELDVADEGARSKLIMRAHVVISLMPPALHYLIARDCAEYRKHLLTASYLDPKIKSLANEVAHKKLLFLCEMGLDPGIDHMSAMSLLDRIKNEGGQVVSFKSHCGGLVAPESNDNPWHYKVSWNPRNIVLAGKAGAVYRQNNQNISENYEDLFDDRRVVSVGHADADVLCYYPNRDSLPYISLYELPGCETFIRTTLRAREFMTGWKEIVQLGLTDETMLYDSDNKTIGEMLRFHLTKNNYNPERASPLFAQQLNSIGFTDTETRIAQKTASAADILQIAIENKLSLKPGDKDMIVMLHEVEYKLQSKKYKVQSSLVVKGDDHIKTAMAKTVGLPLGIAAELILEDQLLCRGVHVPVSKNIYFPVLKELEKFGICFTENTEELK